ncbi:hypothetical protein EVAR_59653_1 [Eumeta japonica]|uniref:Uncharacterized protein n=1 Tax=Eumeta variegata TaxID=151549 RepID=A0A4C1SG03_EUMVA|nr:hypothetical protein EVAR_59653_1 [Eumeta japonica]
MGRRTDETSIGHRISKMKWQRTDYVVHKTGNPWGRNVATTAWTSSPRSRLRTVRHTRDGPALAAGAGRGVPSKAAAPALNPSAVHGSLAAAPGRVVRTR